MVMDKVGDNARRRISRKMPAAYPYLHSHATVARHCLYGTVKADIFEHKNTYYSDPFIRIVERAFCLVKIEKIRKSGSAEAGQLRVVQTA